MLAILKHEFPDIEPRNNKIDKAATEMKSFALVYPYAHHLVCNFHEIEAVRRWVHKHIASKDKKLVEDDLTGLIDLLLEKCTWLNCTTLRKGACKKSGVQ